LTFVVTQIVTRILQILDRAANATQIEIDDKAVEEVRRIILAEGVIANFVDHLYSLLLGGPAPLPVDPLNPPAPPVPRGSLYSAATATPTPAPCSTAARWCAGGATTRGSWA
jgi:hypothetical protein